MEAEKYQITDKEGNEVLASVSTSNYRDWEVYEVLPKGWKIDNSCGSPLHGYDFCTDGKSILNGGKRALVKSIRKGDEIDLSDNKKEIEQPTLF